MQNKGFYIKAVIATGEGMKLSRVDFMPGCNLLFGPSERGKSSIFSVIDFLLGKKENPKPIKEGEGYDTFYMEFVTNSDGLVHTVRRKLDENQVFIKDCVYESFETTVYKGTTYPLQTKKENVIDYSQFLMSLNGFPEGLEIRSTTTKKSSFRYTWIRHLILADENRIVSEKPIFNPDNDSNVRQQEKSVIYYLTSGNDDSAFETSEANNIRKARYKGKIELTEENIKAVENRIEELGDVDYAELKDDAIIQALQKKLTEEENSLSALYESRKDFEENQRKLCSKSLFLKEFVNRMIVLEKHYRTDIERLKYLYEGTTIFGLLDEGQECPLCHSTIEDKSKIDEDYLSAVEVEANNLQTKLKDVELLIKQKREQLAKVEKQIVETGNKIKGIDAEVSGFNLRMTSIKEVLAKYQENLQKKAEAKFLEEEARRLYQKLAILKQEEKTNPQKDAYIRTTNIGEEFCEKLKRKLVEWNVIDPNDSVIFNEDGFDFVLGGKQRLSCGKGARGVTCAAILMTLVEFCDENDIPFSNVLVLDSPITAHFDDEKIPADETTQAKFFKYCNDNISSYQLIIIDNKSPKPEDRETLTNINYIEFADDGRRGFYLGKIES